MAHGVVLALGLRLVYDVDVASCLASLEILAVKVCLMSSNYYRSSRGMMTQILRIPSVRKEGRGRIKRG
jgi:hypothetical protein